MPGYDLKVVDSEGKIVNFFNKKKNSEIFFFNEVAPGVMGNLVVKEPLPPGTLKTLWNDEERFQKSYFSKFPGKIPKKQINIKWK